MNQSHAPAIVGGYTGIVLERMSSAALQLQDLQHLLTEIRREHGSLNRDLSELMKREPKRPASDSPEGVRLQYQADLCKWQQQVRELLGRIDDLNDRMQRLYEEIDRADNDLARLITGDLPQAQRQDAEKLQRELEGLQKQSETLRETIKGSEDSQHIKAEIRKKEILDAEGKTFAIHYPFCVLDCGDSAALAGALGAHAAARPTGDLVEIAGGLAQRASLPGAGAAAASGLGAANDCDVAADDTPISCFPASVQTGFYRLRSSIAEAVGVARVETKRAQATSTAVQTEWASFLARQELGDHTDVNALVQWVLREAYTANTDDLRFYAQKVKFYNDLKKTIRAEITKAREAMSNELDYNPNMQAESQLQLGPGTGGSYEFALIPKDPVLVGGRYQPINPRDGDIDWNGDGVGDGLDVHGISKGIGPDGRKLCLNKRDLDEYISQLEEDLNSVGDDAQLANVDLQNMMQRQQQTLQLMSNLSKMLHDTAMAIIRKIG